MKNKLLYIICISSLLFLGGCKKDVKAPILLPTDVISLEDAKASCGEDANIVMKDNAVKEVGNILSVSYQNDPIGNIDPIEVEVCSPSATFSENEVYGLFEASRSKRNDSIKVTGLCDEAYITYPSLHILSRSNYIKITAGSGSDEEQSDLLVSLGEKAAENLDAYYLRYYGTNN